MVVRPMAMFESDMEFMDELSIKSKRSFSKVAREIFSSGLKTIIENQKIKEKSMFKTYVLKSMIEKNEPFAISVASNDEETVFGHKFDPRPYNITEDCEIFIDMGDGEVKLSIFLIEHCDDSLNDPEKLKEEQDRIENIALINKMKAILNNSSIISAFRARNIVKNSKSLSGIMDQIVSCAKKGNSFLILYSPLENDVVEALKKAGYRITDSENGPMIDW